MDENIPKLTLAPELTGDEIPTLEVTQESALAQTQQPEKTPQAGPEMRQLSEKEQQAVRDFAEKIDISNSNQVLQYGAAAQKNIADFSEAALESVRTKDMGEVGQMLTGLVSELRSFEATDERKGLFGLFRKAGDNINAMKSKYSKVESNVETIARSLENHQLTLLKDVALLDQMYDKNLEYFKQLTMYILAGRQTLTQARTVTLPQMQRDAQQSGQPDDAQKANDFANQCDRFEKKLHDLELTRVISLQMGPQIRMVQNNDTLISEKIQTSLVNTIPLWKSQMVLALGIAHSQQAIKAQRAVSDLTNELLTKNADILKTATIETAKESERAIVDIETVRHTNEQLISTLDEVLKIQTEGRQKRAEAETQLRQIEGTLREKLLQTRA